MAAVGRHAALESAGAAAKRASSRGTAPPASIASTPLLVDALSKREAFSNETREAFETCARARDAAKETALAMERALAEATTRRTPRASPKSRRRADEAMRRVAEHKRAARAANARSLYPSSGNCVRSRRTRPNANVSRSASLKRRARNARRRRRARADATREEHALSTREEVAARASLEKALFGARESLGTARLETEAVRFELTKWQAAVHERDAALDAMSVTRRDAEAALEASRLDALEARRAAAVAEGRARAAVEAEKARRHTGALSGGESRTVANDLDSRELGGFENGGGEYTVAHPASPARRETRRQPRPSSVALGSRAVASAPSPLRRAASHAPPRDRTESVSIEKSGDALAAFTRTAPREGWWRVSGERGGERFFLLFFTSKTNTSPEKNLILSCHFGFSPTASAFRFSRKSDQSSFALLSTGGSR